MASYGSYKRIIADQVPNQSLPDASFAAGTGFKYGIQWIRGPIGGCTPGCCCLWTVPSGVHKLTFELWGAGGNGHGFCAWNRCQHYFGAGGGSYATKTIAVCPGWTYTVCAGGTYGCCSFECVGCCGCVTYVNGCNLSNFCAIGGNPGCANDSWNTMCNSDWNCCVDPTMNNSDFAMGNMRPAGTGPFNCHCYRHTWCASNAPFLAGATTGGELTECWVRHACWTSVYAQGGGGGMTTYCGNWDNGYGGIGGSGVVKITYV